MEIVSEEEVVLQWSEIKLPSLGAEPELERETGERRRGRDILIAIDHGPNSKHAFDWAIVHLCRLADTIHLVHAVSSGTWQQAEFVIRIINVETKARIVEGDAGKAICKEAERLKPAAVVLGTRGRSLLRSVVQGSVSEHCFHHCKSAPVIIVPGKGLISVY
uniref:UspA domain-containing protein n=1 Tax=Daucus carota subsp. sativus TaxID=79200 RepID=A0A166GG05_DAUCS